LTSGRQRDFIHLGLLVIVGGPKTISKALIFKLKIIKIILLKNIKYF